MDNKKQNNTTKILIFSKTKGRLKSRCDKRMSYDKCLNELLNIWEKNRNN